MNVTEHGPADRIAQLRRALLKGRGPGASEQEVADHTRDRPMLRAVPAPLLRRPAQGRASLRRAALAGAVVALVAQAIGTRLLRPHRPPPHQPKGSL